MNIFNQTYIKNYIIPTNVFNLCYVMHDFNTCLFSMLKGFCNFKVGIFNGALETIVFFLITDISFFFCRIVQLKLINFQNVKHGFILDKTKPFRILLGIWHWHFFIEGHLKLHLESFRILFLKLKLVNLDFLNLYLILKYF